MYWLESSTIVFIVFHCFSNPGFLWMGARLRAFTVRVLLTATSVAACVCTQNIHWLFGEFLWTIITGYFPIILTYLSHQNYFINTGQKCSYCAHFALGNSLKKKKKKEIVGFYSLPNDYVIKQGWYLKYVYMTKTNIAKLMWFPEIPVKMKAGRLFIDIHEKKYLNKIRHISLLLSLPICISEWYEGLCSKLEPRNTSLLTTEI